MKVTRPNKFTVNVNLTIGEAKEISVIIAKLRDYEHMPRCVDKCLVRLVQLGRSIEEVITDFTR